MKKIMQLLPLLLLFILVACGDDEDAVDANNEEVEGQEVEQEEEEEESVIPEDEELITVIERNTEAFSNMDIDAYLDTLHSQAPEDEGATRELFENMEGINFEINVYDMNVEEKDEEKATISYVQDSMFDEAGMTSNRTHGTHELQLDGDTWKIFTTMVNETMPIDNEGNVIEQDQAAGSVADIEGEYADKLKEIDISVIEDELVVVEYIEDVGYGHLVAHNEENQTLQFGIEYLENVGENIDIDGWVENLKANFEASNEGITVEAYDTDEEETMFQITVENASLYEDQVQIGRAFFDGTDLYVLSFIDLGTGEIEEDIKETYESFLKEMNL